MGDGEGKRDYQQQRGAANLGLGGKAKTLGHPMGGETSTGLPAGSWRHGGGESLMGPGITEAQLLPEVPLETVRDRENHSGCSPPIFQLSFTAMEPTRRQLGNRVSCNSEQSREGAGMDLRANRKITSPKHKSIWAQSRLHC